MTSEARNDRLPHEARVYGLVFGAVVTIVFLAYLLTEVRANTRLGLSLDDAWIHLTFARNIAAGRGFVFNPGEPVAGSTAPLWTLVLALFHLVFRSAYQMLLIAKLLGGILLFVGALYSGLVASELTRSRWAGLAAGLAVVSFCHFGWAMVSGMEVCLSIAVSLAAVCYYLKWRKGWRAVVPWMLFGVAVWTRPECLLLGGFALLDLLLRRVVLKQRPVFWRGLAAFALVAGSWFAFNLVLNGTLLPQTFVAKAGRLGLLSALSAGDGDRLGYLLTRSAWGYLADFARHLWMANPALALLVPVGVVALAVRAFRRKRVGSFFLPVAVLAFVPLMGVVAPGFGPLFQSGRHVGAATALALVAGMAGAGLLVERLRSRAARLSVAAGLSVLVVFNAVVAGAGCVRFAAGAASSINRMQVRIAEWLGQKIPGDAVIACVDVGAIGYFSGRRVLDLFGLVSREAVPYLESRPQLIEGQRALVLERKPDIVVVSAGDFGELVSVGQAAPMVKFEARDNLASQFVFLPRVRVVAGVLLAGWEVVPIPSALGAFRYDWSGGGTVPSPGQG